MDRTFSCAFSTVSLCLAMGCGSSSDSKSAEAGRAASKAAQLASDAEQTSIAAAAQGFLEAVIQGDTQLATTFLTPQAAERLQEGGEAFQPPGLDTWSCRIGEVRRMNDAQAFVQCYWSDPSVTGETPDEMCCLVKLVDGKWRVSGIAFQVNPGEMPRILDFERPAQSGAAPQQMASQPESGGDSSYYNQVSPTTPREAQRPDQNSRH